MRKLNSKNKLLILGKSLSIILLSIEKWVTILVMSSSFLIWFFDKDLLSLYKDVISSFI